MRRIAVLGLAVLLASLTACSLHQPQEATLPVAIPTAYVEAGASTAPPGERWWESFADPRLDALIDEAFVANLDLEQAFARLQQAEAQLQSTAAAQRPFLTLQGEIKEEKTPSFFDDNRGTSHRVSAAAGYEVDLWRKLADRTRGARLDLAASRREVETLYLTLAARVADLYFLAVEQRAQLDLTDRSIAAFADTLERVERRYREGLVPALDVYQSRQNLAGARSRRPQFENALAATEHALAVLLGRYPEGAATGGLAVLPGAAEQFAAGLPSQLLARRPDVEAALLRLQASDARIAAAIAERFPSVNLLANYGHLSTAFATGDIVGAFWNVAVDLAQPVLDGGRRTAEVERNRAVFRENLARYQQAVLTAFQEVEDALAANRTTEERITFLAQREEASEAALRLALDRYLQGLSDYLPVLTAQGLYFDAQSQTLSARRQLLADRITLARALGGEWMHEEAGRRIEPL
jgi:NodT family efflux transporter outer membrane factor (OMF) lipoprotein